MSGEQDIPLVGDDSGAHPCTVVDLAQVRIAWGKRAPGAPPACKHTSLIYSLEERRIWCQQCETTVETFDAFLILCSYWHAMQHDLKLRQDVVNAALKHNIRRRAVKALDRAWSAPQVMAVGCPHCSGGLLPEDFVGGGKVVRSREIELARRKAARTKARQQHGGALPT